MTRLPFLEKLRVKSSFSLFRIFFQSKPSAFFVVAFSLSVFGSSLFFCCFAVFYFSCNHGGVLCRFFIGRLGFLGAWAGDTAHGCPPVALAHARLLFLGGDYFHCCDSRIPKYRTCFKRDSVIAFLCKFRFYKSIIVKV